MNIITQTPRLIIREFSTDEMDIYLNHFNDEAVAQHIPRRSRDERIAIFNTAINQYQQTKATGIWGIFHKDNNDFIGSCLLRFFENEPHILELGYSLEQLYWGLGIGSEMARAMVAYAFNNADVQKIVAVTTPANTASQRVLVKAGLKQGDNVNRNNELLSFFSISR